MPLDLPHLPFNPLTLPDVSASSVHMYSEVRAFPSGTQTPFEVDGGNVMATEVGATPNGSVVVYENGFGEECKVVVERGGSAFVLARRVTGLRDPADERNVAGGVSMSVPHSAWYPRNMTRVDASAVPRTVARGATEVFPGASVFANDAFNLTLSAVSAAPASLVAVYDPDDDEYSFTGRTAGVHVVTLKATHFLGPRTARLAVEVT